jgi:hypothetical protein
MLSERAGVRSNFEPATCHLKPLRLHSCPAESGLSGRVRRPPNLEPATCNPVFRPVASEVGRARPRHKPNPREEPRAMRLAHDARSGRACPKCGRNVAEMGQVWCEPREACVQCMSMGEYPAELCAGRMAKSFRQRDTEGGGSSLIPLIPHRIIRTGAAQSSETSETSEPHPPPSRPRKLRIWNIYPLQRGG